MPYGIMFSVAERTPLSGATVRQHRRPWQMPEPTTTPGIAWAHLMSNPTIESQAVEALIKELVQTITTRWIELDQDLTVWEESDTGVCTDRVRQIGEQINRIAGYPALLAIRDQVAKFAGEFSPGLEHAFNAEINWSWNGIGNWQA